MDNIESCIVEEIKFDVDSENLSLFEDNILFETYKVGC
jgi:hypothetical protein